MTDSTSDNSNRPANHRARRVRFAPVAVLGGVAASAVIALSMSGTLAGFVAQITNSTNNAATGYLTMRETQTVGGVTTTCDSNISSAQANQAVCATINKYGGSTTMVPDQTVSTTVTITNTGTVPANTFTLASQGCTQSTNGAVNGTAQDLCDKMQVSVTQGGTAVTGATNVSLTNFANKTFQLTGPIAPNGSAVFVFSVKLPSQSASATTANPFPDNAYQGLKASQALVWQFTS